MFDGTASSQALLSGRLHPSTIAVEDLGILLRLVTRCRHSCGPWALSSFSFANACEIRALKSLAQGDAFRVYCALGDGMQLRFQRAPRRNLLFRGTNARFRGLATREAAFLISARQASAESHQFVREVPEATSDTTRLARSARQTKTRFAFANLLQAEGVNEWLRRIVSTCCSPAHHGELLFSLNRAYKLRLQPRKV